MQVTYPSHHSWLKDIVPGVDINFSGRVAKKIQATLPLLEKASIIYTVLPLSEDFLHDFMPMYNQKIGTKENVLEQDVTAKTLHNTKSPFPYYCLSLRENGEFVGGTIFSLRSDKVSFAYRTFNTHWNSAESLKASPALIGEHAVTKFAADQGLTSVMHGKDRNPYGLNASIGLASFKLSVGCRPSVPRDYELKTIDTDTITEDCLILELPKSGSLITKAYLTTKRENEHQYTRATKYPEQLTVEVLYRD